MPTRKHGRTVSKLIIALGSHLEAESSCEVLTEVRHRSRAGSRLYLPDVEVAQRTGVSSDPVPEPPDIAIEVLSPDDSASRVLDRVDFLLSEGVQIVWVVDPELETVSDYRSGSMHLLRKGDSLDGSPVLAGFTLPLVDLFSSQA
jgi:Uma2 family endonuclease